MDNAATQPPEPQDENLSGWEYALARHVVRHFVLEWGALRPIDENDLVQEILLQWMTQRPRYEGTRGANLQTFFRRVARNRLIDIYREQQADKRGGKRVQLSLEKPVGDDEDSAVLGDFVKDPRNVAEEVESKVGQEHILQLLTPRQRELALGLAQGYSMAEVARKMKVPRTSLNDELSRIRRVLRRHGHGPT
ncbi:MAG: RNA polymerase sigma factor [Chloroflexi bacterium]|nr:RNA polymerase sigma factor [Chloroflexota bacterium]